MIKLRRRSYRRAKSEMNVVPYIDVMLVLLVIFMIAAPLIQQSVSVDLPQAKARTAASPPEDALTLPLVLTVDARGEYYLNIGVTPVKPLSPAQMVAEAKAYLRAHPRIDVYVRGDARVPYDRIIGALEYLRAAGADKVNLSTQPPGNPSAPPS